MRIQTTDPKAIAAICKQLGIEDIPDALTVTSAKSVAGRPCECGCGEATKGGKWVPGHDAKHKSKLHDLVRSGDAAAAAELDTRDWPQPVIKTKAVEPVAEAA